MIGDEADFDIVISGLERFDSFAELVAEEVSEDPEMQGRRGILSNREHHDSEQSFVHMARGKREDMDRLLLCLRFGCHAPPRSPLAGLRFLSRAEMQDYVGSDAERLHLDVLLCLGAPVGDALQVDQLHRERLHCLLLALDLQFGVAQSDLVVTEPVRAELEVVWVLHRDRVCRIRCPNSGHHKSIP